MPSFIGATRGTTTERGYGNPHMQARRPAFKALPEYSPCARCGQVMWKFETETLRDGRTRSALHYDHDEYGGYLGFSHKRCNITAAASKAGRIIAARHARIRALKPGRKTRAANTGVSSGAAHTAQQRWHSRAW